MCARRVVFAGPSLPPPWPRIPDLEFRAPAARGDLLRAVDEGARVIGLIDGVFHQTLAVTPGEVRAAASRGARLLGGASLGAMRACECPKDMQGVGEIWAAFVRGELADDEEVAVTFLPDTYELVGYPLVQVREAARMARVRYSSVADLASRFVELVRLLPFQERTLQSLHAAARVLVEAKVPWEELKVWLTAPEFDVKRRDAIAVVKCVEDG